MSTCTRPVLRYHGGKWRLAPWIISHFPPHRVYVEPFGGAASVLLREPESAARLRDAVRLTPFAREEFDDCYEATTDAVESARRLVLRSHGGFGTAAMRATAAGRMQRTGFRANTTRSGTTPAADWCQMPDVLNAVAERLRGVVVEHRPAMQVIATHDGPETLHYVDPPYPHDTRTNSSRWNYRHEMTDDDHRALAAVLRSAEGAVVLSGYACDMYDRELYAGWHRVEKATHADGARPRTEVLWLNAAASSRLEAPDAH